MFGRYKETLQVDEGPVSDTDKNSMPAQMIFFNDFPAGPLKLVALGWAIVVTLSLEPCVLNK